MRLEDLPPLMRAQAETKLGEQKARPKSPQPSQSKPEAALELQLKVTDTPLGEAEYRFDDVRKWRLDRAWPEAKFAIEIEGLTAEGGRHQRIAGFKADCEKYEAAMLAGWNVYRCHPGMISSGRALAVIRHMLGVEPLGRAPIREDRRQHHRGASGDVGRVEGTG